MTKGFDVQGLRSNAKSILMRDRRRDYKLAGNCIDNRIACESCFTLTAVGAVPDRTVVDTEPSAALMLVVVDNVMPPDAVFNENVTA